MPFYDTHLHLFNSAHIPLYMTLKRAMKTNLSGLKGEGIGFAAALAGMFGQFDNFLEAKFERKAGFLRYFDRMVGDNLTHVVGEIKEALSTDTPLGNDMLVLTPLILDLELHEPAKRLKDQIADVLAGIDRIQPSMGDRLRVFPFIGLDLRRFKSAETIVKDFNDLVKEVLGNRFASPKGKTAETIDSGTCIGIKIYPQLDVDPANKTYRPLFVELANRGIPVTVHCQPDGYQLGDKKGKELENYAHPSRWREVLLDPAASTLKINFAHFGGEGEVRKTVNWQSIDSVRGMGSSLGNRYDGFNKATWTYQIVELLRCFPNTYADISAFDFTDKHAKAALRWLLWPGNHEIETVTPGLATNLPAKHLLSDKLLWGSDYPMPLDEESVPNYWTLWAGYKKAIGLEHDPKIDGVSGPDVPKASSGAAKDLMKQMVTGNAERFLFG